MNALATTGTSQANLLPGLTTPVLTANPTLATPAFVNLIGLFLSSPNLASPQKPTTAPDTGKIPTAKAPVILASPAQIADAMIRSMLGNHSGNPALGSNNPASVPSAIRLGSASFASISILSQGDVSGRAITAATTILPLDHTKAPVTADSIATDPTRKLAMTLPGNAATPNPTTAQSPRKQLRGGTDLALVTTVVIAPAPVFIAASAVAPPPSVTNAAVSSGQLESNTPAALPNSPGKFSPAGENAFTAILTPMKEMAILTPPKSTPSVPATTLPAAAPSTSAPESTTWQGSQTHTNGQVQATAAQTTGGTAGGGTQQGAEQGGDRSSQQQSNLPETSTRLTGVSTDTKIKSDVVKTDEGTTQALATAAIGTLHGSSVTSPGGAPIAFLADPAHVATASQSAAPAATATLFRSTAEALRTSEPTMPAAPQLRTGTVQEISIRIAPPDAPPVDLRVIERSGQVHIDVRTPDVGMQTSLREELGTLTNSLQRAGYHTETFTPSSSPVRAASSAQMSNQDDRQDPSQNRGGSGNYSGGRRQQQQQQRPSTRLAELEDQK